VEVSGELHASAALHPGKSPRYPLDRRLGGTQSLSGREDEEKNNLPLPGIKPRPSNPQPSHYNDELRRLFNTEYYQLKWLNQDTWTDFKSCPPHH